MKIGEKNKSWSKTLNIIQSIDDTVAAKAMYSQFEKKTILKASKRFDGRNNPITDDHDDDVEGDDDGMEEPGLVVFSTLFPLLNRITLAYSLTQLLIYYGLE